MTGVVGQGDRIGSEVVFYCKEKLYTKRKLSLSF